VTYFKLALIGLQIIHSIIGYLEKQGIIKDEQRRELLRQLQLSADALAFKNKTKEDVSKLDEKQVDDALSGDFRP